MIDESNNYLNPEIQELHDHIKNLNNSLSNNIKSLYNRTLPMPELYNNRWQKAKDLGFGEGSNIYDQSYVFGDVQVGKNCWIGMMTILDGSGGLIIGQNCTISAGVHIYTHDNLLSTLDPDNYSIEKSKVEIENNCYIGPLSIISKGVILGDHSVVAAKSFVNKSFPSNSIIAGTPAKKIGAIELENNEVKFHYFHKDSATQEHKIHE
jgi:acetyltransferase-like isoleucine patch superfamily enzyme